MVILPSKLFLFSNFLKLFSSWNYCLQLGGEYSWTLPQSVTSSFSLQSIDLSAFDRHGHLLRSYLLRSVIKLYKLGCFIVYHLPAALAVWVDLPLLILELAHGHQVGRLFSEIVQNIRTWPPGGIIILRKSSKHTNLATIFRESPGHQVDEKVRNIQTRPMDLIKIFHSFLIH